MWTLYQKDIVQIIEPLRAAVSSWEGSAPSIEEVAALNDKLKVLVAGSKINKAVAISTMLTPFQSFSEGLANDSLSLKDELLAVANDFVDAMVGMGGAEDLKSYYQENEPAFLAVIERLREASGADALEENLMVRENRPPVSSTGSGSDVPDIVKIFLLEVADKTDSMIDCLLKLEKAGGNLAVFEELMRCAHSLKGGARLSGLDDIVDFAHLLEDMFILAQQGKKTFSRHGIDCLMQCVDLLIEMASRDRGLDNAEQDAERKNKQDDLFKQLEADEGSFEPSVVGTDVDSDIDESIDDDATSDTVRLSNDNLQKIIRRSSDMKIDAMRLASMSKDFSRIYKTLSKLNFQMSNHYIQHSDGVLDKQFVIDFQAELNTLMNGCGQLVEHYDFVSSSNLASLQHLSREALVCRMGSFNQCLGGVARLVRNLSRKQGKEIDLVVKGKSTPVDREIIQAFIPALTHLVQNAVDHGVETTAERQAANKPETACIELTAEHRSGYLIIEIKDDGRGVNLDQVRKKILAEGLINESMVNELSVEELYTFLFLPNFTLKKELTTVSGRGVGLDLVHEFVTKSQGKVQVHSVHGEGTTFEFRLPVTLATIRCVIVSVNHQTYGIPVYQLERVEDFDESLVNYVEGRAVIHRHNEDVYLFKGDQALGLGASPEKPEKLLIMKSTYGTYALMVDKLIDEIELVDSPFHPNIGKLRDVRSASALPDGTPVLIIDVEDLLTGMEKQLYGQAVTGWESGSETVAQGLKVLVVDDSLTVREVERNMLMAGGYSVDVAVDGVDAWNQLKHNQYDLLVTDIDMPRMNGWELLDKVRADNHLGQIPVIVVSYKDRQEDFDRGLEAGADSYVTKGSFQNDGFMNTVRELIGDANLD